MRRAIGAVALVAVLGIGVTTVEAAIPGFPLPQLQVSGGAAVFPKAMPDNGYVPVSTSVTGKIETSDGTHPSALREAFVNVDRDVKINARDFPSCPGAGRILRKHPAAVKKACREAILGSGKAHFELAFPDRPPILVGSPLTVLNGGEKAGEARLLIHAFITVPVPAAIVTQVTIQRKGSGVRSVAKVPVIAGGSGSTLAFKFKLGKTYRHKGKKVGYFEAKCPDGKFKVTTPRILFKNEARIAGVPPTTTLKGSLLVPCRPKG